MSPGGAHSLRNTGAAHNIHWHLQEHKSVLAEIEVLPPILLSTEESPNEKTVLLLFHVNTEPTWGMGQKGMYFYSYSFIWQYRSLKCDLIEWTKILCLNGNHTYNYSYYIKKPCKNYCVLGYFLIFERGILNYSASDKACHVHFHSFLFLSLSHKSIPPKQSVTSVSQEILNYWTVCHSLIPALLWCTTDNFKMAYENPPTLYFLPVLPSDAVTHRI